VYSSRCCGRRDSSGSASMEHWWRTTLQRSPCCCFSRKAALAQRRAGAPARSRNSSVCPSRSPGGLRVVARQRAVGEVVLVAFIKKQLGALRRLDERPVDYVPRITGSLTRSGRPRRYRVGGQKHAASGCCMPRECSGLRGRVQPAPRRRCADQPARCVDPAPTRNFDPHETGHARGSCVIACARTRAPKLRAFREAALNDESRLSDERYKTRCTRRPTEQH
jgi:hypothetical protein